VTLMLASVTSLADIEAALAGGADVIDVAGAGPSPQTVRDTVAAVAGRRPVSAAVGPGAPDAVAVMADAGAAWVRVEVDQPGPLPHLAPFAHRVRLVAVLPTGHTPAFELLPRLAETGFTGVMLDTAWQRSGRLLDHVGMPALARFVADALAHGLTSGLAGALEPPDIPRLLVLHPGLLRFGRALREESRITLAATRRVRSLIPSATPDAAAAGRLPDGPADCVFVHDLVLPCRIGAYARERDAPQRVRFNVDAFLRRPPRPAHDLRDTLSYDVITDAIRMLVEAGHVELVETLAERIAAILLGDQRVLRVRVRVEKLDTPSGAIGVAIERAAVA